MARYIQIQGGQGIFFEKVAEGAEDAVLYTKKDGDSYWRKEFNEMYATLQSIELRDSDFGRQLQILLHPEGTTDNLYLQINFDGMYGVDAYAEDFITHLGNLDKGVLYRWFCYLMEATDDRPYASRGISIKEVVGDDLLKVERALQYNKRDEDDPTKIPQAIKTRKAGKDIWDRTEKDDFLYQELMAQMERFPAEKQRTAASRTRTRDEAPEEVPEPTKRTPPKAQEKATAKTPPARTATKAPPAKAEVVGRTTSRIPEKRQVAPVGKSQPPSRSSTRHVAAEPEEDEYSDLPF